MERTLIVLSLLEQWVVTEDILKIGMSFQKVLYNFRVIIYSLRAVIHYSEYYITSPYLPFNYFIYCLLEMNSVTTQETAVGSQFLNILSSDSIRGS